MTQPIELRSISDLSQYMANMNKTRSSSTFDEKRKLYLYVFNKNSDTCRLHIDTKHKDGRYLSYQDVQCHIDAGTMHIGRPLDVKIRANHPPYTHLNETQRNQKLGWTLSQETGWGFNAHVKQDVGDIIHLEYAVVHELKPGARRFEDISRKIEENPDGTHNTFHMIVSPVMFEEVRVFDIGDIGYELRDMTPEQAAETYFGVSDFRQFFSNYDAASKQMSITPRERRLFRMAPLALTGMHPVKPSSFREYVKAGKQLFSGKHQVNPDVTPSNTAALLSGAAGGLMLTSGRPFSAMAAMTLPFLGKIHSRIREQQELNALQRKKTVALTDEEREKLLAKGALASELTRRLTTTPSQSRPDLFKHIHSKVHQKPKSARIHWSPGKGGRKIRRTKKK
jgi:hypothetical protein